MLKIALTGGTACGKSLAAKYFAKLGIAVIDADVIVHALTAPNTPATQKIIAHFGKLACDKKGHLKRRYLRKIIFANAKERHWLENLIHPYVYKEMCKSIKQVTSPYCILAIPLLFETKTKAFRKLPQRILAVTAPREVQIKRLMQRDRLTRAEACAMLATQIEHDKRFSVANDVIYNQKGKRELKKQVAALHKKYLAKAVNASWKPETTHF